MFFNQSPTISFDQDEIITLPDGTITGVVHAYDPDSPNLTFTASTPINGGSVVVDASGHFTYTPASAFAQSGGDLFDVTVSDAANGWHTHGFLGLLFPGWGETASTAVSVGDGMTAGAKYGWQTPSGTTKFTDSSALLGWYVYNGAGNGGYGRRTPDAISFANNTMIITGDEQGVTAGLAWWPGQQYGAWEVRVKVPEGAPNYNPVVLLWPDAENWPTGGEVDFLEIQRDPLRQHVSAALHYSPTNKWVSSDVKIDATQWHNYAVAWTPTAITAYVDGLPFATATDTSTFPPGSMHLCIQLDVGGTDLAGGAQMMVAWARRYSLTAVE
jgi:hypothetical protein